VGQCSGVTPEALAVAAVPADNHAVAWLDEWTQVLEDCPLDRGRAEVRAWLDAHGVSEADRDRVVRVEIVKTADRDVLRLLGTLRLSPKPRAGRLRAERGRLGQCSRMTPDAESRVTLVG
jgi:hypothetical protein